MTYRSAENIIRSIMAKTAGVNINEDTDQRSHMTPALKTPDEERLSNAVNILKNHGCPSAKIDGNKVSVDAMDMNRASDVLERALNHGLITVRPELASPEAIAVPEPHVPAPVETPTAVHKEEIDLAPDAKDEDDQTPKGEIEADGTVKLEKRTLRNRQENQMKKVDEEQIDELSTETLHKVANVARKSGRTSVLKAAIKAGKRKREQPDYKFAGEDKTDEVFDASAQQLDELSLAKLTSYKKVAGKTKGNVLDKKIQKRAKGVAMASKKIQQTVSKALFGEEATPLNMIKRVRMIAESKGRLKCTLNSECGNHKAKIYKDSEWNEHRVEFHINGKHHEPADYHTPDYDDAHGTAHAELKRLSKLNGALKESTEEEILELLEDEQIDEISRAAAAQYIRTSANTMRYHEGERTDATRDLRHLETDNSPAGNEKYKNARDKLHASSKGIRNRWKGITNATKKLEGAAKINATEEVAKEGNGPFLSEDLGLQHIGTYKTTGGHTLKMLRSNKDSKHLLLSNNGTVVDSHVGSAKDFHRKVTGGIHGLRGYLHEAEQIDEISKELLGRFIERSSEKMASRVADAHYHRDQKARDVQKYGHDKYGHGNAMGKTWRQSEKHRKAISKAVSRLTKEEAEQLDEANLRDVSKKLEHHGYKKFGDSDKISHREILSTYHHADHGHLISVNHREHGHVNSVSALKCTNPKTGAMASDWGDDHPHVEGALRELGHKSYVGFKEETQIDELSNKALSSYTKKAMNNGADAAFKTGRHLSGRYFGDHDNDSDAQSNRRDASYLKTSNTEAKRQRGLKSAAKAFDRNDAPRGKAAARAAQNHVGLNYDLGHNSKELEHGKHNFDTDEAHQRDVNNRQRLATKLKQKTLKNLSQVKEETQIDEVDLKDFKRKHVQGLYHFNHFEHPNGSWIQTHVRDKKFIHSDGKGKHTKFDNIEDLKKHVESLKEETQIDELSSGTLSRYAIKAAASKIDHMNKGAAAFGRSNGQRGEPEVREKLQKDAQNHSRKVWNRHHGAKKATEKLTKKPESAGVCENALNKIEEAVKRKPGRPKKPRHENGEIVNDPKANS
jgi:hypothetical protein